MKYTDLCEHLERMARRDRDGATQAISRLAKRLHEANAERLEQAAAAIRELEAERDVSNEIGRAFEEDAGQQRERAEAAEARVAELTRERDAATFYIDCEFDGHNGPLLSFAMVREDGYGLHVVVRDIAVSDQWVAANVMPILDSHNADIGCSVRANEVGGVLRGFIGDCQNPTIIADSPVDIGRFCRAISTGPDGGWASADYPGMTFVVRNVDCYPTTLQGAVQHNAWWDAMALRAAIRKGATP